MSSSVMVRSNNRDEKQKQANKWVSEWVSEQASKQASEEKAKQKQKDGNKETKKREREGKSERDKEEEERNTKEWSENIPTAYNSHNSLACNKMNTLKQEGRQMRYDNWLCNDTLHFFFVISFISHPFSSFNSTLPTLFSTCKWETKHKEREREYFKERKS